MSVGSSGGGGGGGGGGGASGWPPFTAAQWQELEHQALIFKYLKAGLPVPPDLLAPIHRSLESMSARFLHYPTLGYYSFYGKKIDPEPGRCRRTDGKKWRCSKDAHPDSKYCERHMNRGRYRSRKPVESQTTSQSLSTPKLDVGIGSSAGGMFQNLPMHSNSVNLSFGSHPSQMQVETNPYGSCNKYSEPKPQAEMNKSLLQASSSGRGLEMKSAMDIHHPTSRAPADLLSNSRNGIPLHGTYSSLQKQQKQHYFFGMEFNSPGTVKQEQQLVQPFFDEWPEARESRSFLDSQRSDVSSFSSTQLSMCIDKDPSKLLARDSQSPNDVEGNMCNFQG